MRGVRKTRRSQYYRSVERGANAKESNRYTGTELTSDSRRYFAISSTIRVNFSNPIRPTGWLLPTPTIDGDRQISGGQIIFPATLWTVVKKFSPRFVFLLILYLQPTIQSRPKVC